MSIRVRDWAGAVAWYRDKLGLQPAGLHDDPWCLMTFPEGDAAPALDGTKPVASGNKFEGNQSNLYEYVRST
ncbi:MAG TPA: hypothetical protein VK745_29710 [Polyangiaceae bacterium]|nr:hypothetical protein [Polyangiaceae bacterium]